MIDHVEASVSRDLEKAKAFYTEALAPLGYSVHFEADGMVYFADATALDFGVGATRSSGRHARRVHGTRSRTRCDAFYDAALAAGGDDNGAPGLRPAVRRELLRARTFSIPTETTSRRSATRCRNQAT